MVEEDFLLSPLPTGTGHDLFRIIAIQAGDDNEPLQCSITNETLKGCEPYEALSYCYGDGPCDQTVLVRDEQSSDDLRKLHIMSNLFAAIKRLRYRWDPRRLWIDALCINQKDDQEKASQIQLMRTIYQNASRVVVWLGEAADDSDRALKLLLRVNAVMEDDRCTGYKRDLTYIMHRPPEFPPMVDPIWRSLKSILSRPWFKRAWIVQEIALAREAVVICGDSEVKWESLTGGFEYLLTTRCYTLGLDTDGLCLLLQHDDTRMRLAAKKPDNLMHILIKNRTQSATHPLDAIYAFHGLFEQGTTASQATIPNYSISYRELSLNVAVSILHETENLDLLACSRHALDGGPKYVPSWVPVWGSKTSVESIRWRQIEPEHNPRSIPDYCASAETATKFMLSDDDSKLHLFGYTVTRINTLSEAYGGETAYDFDVEVMLHNNRMLEGLEEVACSDLDPAYHFEDMADVIRAMALGKEFPYRHVPYDNIVHAFYKTLIAGNMNGLKENEIDFMFSLWYAKRIEVRTMINTAEEERLDLEEMVRNYLSETGEQAAALEAIVEGLGLEDYGPLAMTTVMAQFGAMTRCCSYRKMMKAENGMLGLVPQLAEEGDTVVLAAGGKTPFILRKPPHSSNSIEGSTCPKQYEFIGEAYVHGLMDGTEWLTLRLRGTKEEEFVLV